MLKFFEFQTVSHKHPLHALWNQVYTIKYDINKYKNNSFGKDTKKLPLPSVGLVVDALRIWSTRYT